TEFSNYNDVGIVIIKGKVELAVGEVACTISWEMIEKKNAYDFSNWSKDRISPEDIEKNEIPIIYPIKVNDYPPKGIVEKFTDGCQLL
ncbi:hypothetical protein ACFLY6_03160, partial [Candidatus Dependentiae bacterium]